MYNNQTQDLKNSILNSNGFECKVLDPNFLKIKILGVRKVPSNINNGNHHIYVDLENYRGRDYRVKFNEGIYYTFDKPSNETGTNVPMFSSGNKIQIVGSDGSYSQIIGDLTSSHTDAGHSSYYVYAKLVNDVTLPDPPTDPEVPNPELPNTNQATLKDIINELEEIIYRLDELVEKL